MTVESYVLVAIMNNLRDFAIARDFHWYRVPVRSTPKQWPPRYLAFYQTKVFEQERYAIHWHAPVLGIETARRSELLPGECDHPRADALYYKINLGALQRLPRPIPSRRLRRIVFIPTTWDKLLSAAEINDLYHESPLEDELWSLYKRVRIVAERQYFIEVEMRRYALDFAIFCRKGKIDVETDGDTWHADVKRIPLDNQRDNDLTRKGWGVLRFNGRQIRESPDSCVATTMDAINRHEGLDTDGLVPTKFNPRDPDGPQQLTLFEESPPYEID